MSTIGELTTLQGSGLVDVAATVPELEYLFRHALVQDAAYSSLLKQDRRTLHRRAAEALIAIYPERKQELAALIAMHFEQAGDAAAAAEYLVIAGEHAAERFANREALGFFDRAVGLLPADDPRIDLRLRAIIGQGRVGFTFTGTDAFIERLEKIIVEAETRADRRLVADAYFWLAFIRRWRGEQASTSPALKRALDRAAKIREELGDPAANAFPKAFLGVGQIFSGQLREGTKEAQEALDVIAKDKTAEPVSTGMLFNFLAMGYARLGEFAAAEHALAQSVGLGARGDEISRLDVNIARTGLEIERGDLAQSVTRATQCAEQAEALGAVACAVGANIYLGAGRLYQEDVLGAKQPVERGLELSSMTNMVPMRTVAQALAGSVRARLGDAPAGLAGWGEALATARGMADKYGEAVTLWNRGRTYARQAQPDYGAAIADLDEAARQFEAMEARPALARVLRDRATVLRALERAGEADEADRRSRDLARELGLRDFPEAA